MVIGIARRTKTCNVPVVAVVGNIGDHIEKAYDEGVSAIFSINRAAIPFETARLRCREDMASAMDNILRFAAVIF